MGAVSPAALPMLKMTPVRIPGREAGRTIFLMVCHLVAPRARDASLKDWGMDVNASREAEMIPGSIRMPRVRLPDRMETPNPRYLTNTARPKRPKTTEGTPARLFILILSILVTRLSGVYSVRYMAQASPSGSEKTIAPKVR